MRSGVRAIADVGHGGRRVRSCIYADVDARSRSPARSSCSSVTNSSPKAASPTRSTPTRRRCTPRRRPIRGRRGRAWFSRRCASPSSARRGPEAATLLDRVAGTIRAPWRSTPMRCGRRVSSRKPRHGTATRSSMHPELARGLHGMARSLAARSKLDEALDRRRRRRCATRPRDLEIHHTVGVDLRAHAPVRRGRRRVHQLRQPAAEQGPQREGRLVARRDQVPALVRSAGAVRNGSGRRRADLHGRLPPRARQDRGAREGQRRIVSGLRRRHRRREHHHLAADGAAARHHADHLHAERRRRQCRPARPAAGADQLARARAAEAAQRPVPHQGSAAARPAGEGSREPVAAGARASR